MQSSPFTPSIPGRVPMARPVLSADPITKILKRREDCTACGGERFEGYQHICPALADAPYEEDFLP